MSILEQSKKLFLWLLLITTTTTALILLVHIHSLHSVDIWWAKFFQKGSSFGKEPEGAYID